MTWTKASKERRCPKCGSIDKGVYKRGCEWTAGYKKGTNYVVCMFESDGAVTQTFIGEFGRWAYSHILDEDTNHPVSLIDTANTVAHAAPITFHKTYAALCDGILYPGHSNYMTTRKTPQAVSKRARYTSVSTDKDKRNTRAGGLLSLGHTLTGVPGFWLDNKNNWHLEGPPGILIPVRDHDGNITGCQINTNRAIETYMEYTAVGKPIPEDQRWKSKGKYLWLSSAPEMKTYEGRTYLARVTGVPALPRIHFPITGKRVGGTGAITEFLGSVGERHDFNVVEGILKADVAAFLDKSDERFIGMPGGSTGQNEAANFLVNARLAYIAFDPDWAINDKFFETTKTFIEKVKLKRMNEPTFIKYWPLALGKGYDDLLLNSNQDAIRMASVDYWLDDEFRNKEIIPYVTRAE